MIPPAPANASKDEVREWEAYHKFCARSELFGLLEAGQAAEARIEDQLQRGREVAAGYDGGGQGDDSDELDHTVLSSEELLSLEVELDECRRVHSDQVLSVISEYNPRPVVQSKGKAKDPDLERLAALMPSPAAIIAEVEAAVAKAALKEKQQKQQKQQASAAEGGGDERGGEGAAVAVAKQSPPARKPKPKPLEMPGIDVAPQMERAAREDATNQLPMKDLPVMRPVDTTGADDGAKDEGEIYINPSFKGTVEDHTQEIDLGFPTLEFYRRKEMDSAEYFMPGFKAKAYSPLQSQGGFWVGVRQEARGRAEAEHDAAADVEAGAAGGAQPAVAKDTANKEKKKAKKAKKGAKKSGKTATGGGGGGGARDQQAAQAEQALLPSRVDGLIAKLSASQASLPLVLNELPGALRAHLNSDEFAEACLAQFDELDVDYSGALVTSEMSDAITKLNPASSAGSTAPVTKSQCGRLAAIFDADRSGLISKGEYVRFSQSVLALSYLEYLSSMTMSTATGSGGAAAKSMGTKGMIDAMMERGKGAIEQIMAMPMLPDELGALLNDPYFEDTCHDRFLSLDDDASGVLTADELWPAVLQLAQEHDWASQSVGPEHCTRFMKIFDDDGNGELDEPEFAAFARFVLVMAFLESQHASEMEMDEDAFTEGVGLGLNPKRSSGGNASITDASHGDDGHDDRADDPDFALVKALRHAIVAAAVVRQDGAGNYEFDYKAALETFIGPGSSVCSSEQFAALLRPMAAHWGGAASRLVSRDSHATRRIARLVASGQAGGIITAEALRMFVDETQADDGDDYAEEDYEEDGEHTQESILENPGQGEEVVLADPDGDGAEDGLLYREMQRLDDDAFVLFTVRTLLDGATAAAGETADDGADAAAGPVRVQVSSLTYPSEDFRAVEHKVARSEWPLDADAQKELARDLVSGVVFSPTTGELTLNATAAPLLDEREERETALTRERRLAPPVLRAPT